MCGIAGFIGSSKNPHITYELITTLFEKTESRGEDASGFWGANKDNIIYHKEPLKSSRFVLKDAWKNLERFNPNLLLIHARAASVGFGVPIINKNNHPFTSSDKTIGLIHNGRIAEPDYRALKKKYEVFSDCDSEMYLRIFESQDDKISSLKTLWSVLGRSQMAVAIGEKINDERKLWFFRNRWRSLWLADLRQNLGQIFFFSTPDIWEEAVWFCDEARSYLKRTKMIELPPEEIWQFTYSQNEFKRSYFEVKASGNFKPWAFDGQLVKIQKKEPVCKIVTILNDDEDLPDRKKNTLAPYIDRPVPFGTLYGPNYKPPHRAWNASSGWSTGELYPDMSDTKKSAQKISEL